MKYSRERETNTQGYEIKLPVNRIVLYLCYADRSCAELCAGQFEAAAESGAKCQAITQELEGQLLLADILASTIAEIALSKGQVEEALSLAEQAAAMAESLRLFELGEGRLYAARIWMLTLSGSDPMPLT